MAPCALLRAAPASPQLSRPSPLSSTPLHLLPPPSPSTYPNPAARCHLITLSRRPCPHPPSSTSASAAASSYYVNKILLPTSFSHPLSTSSRSKDTDTDKKGILPPRRCRGWRGCSWRRRARTRCSRASTSPSAPGSSLGPACGMLASTDIAISEHHR
jgi:hypothetical protein